MPSIQSSFGILQNFKILKHYLKQINAQNHTRFHNKHQILSNKSEFQLNEKKKFNLKSKKTFFAPQLVHIQVSPYSVNGNTMEEKSEAFETASVTTGRRCVVVFDIDNTLCYSSGIKCDTEFLQKKHPECPIIEWAQPSKYFKTVHLHYHLFLPYLQILFNYLMEQGARIVFFSSAPKERNTFVIPELLTSFWGSEKYEILKSVGQFAIFSENDLRKRRGEGEGAHVKDLSVVIQDSESILDTILVEDDPSFCAHDQRPHMRIIDLMYWRVSDNSFYLNGTYYMLGLFKSYFEDEKYYKKLSIREGIHQIVRAETDKFYHPDYSCYKESNPFMLKIFGIGLSEVQKCIPDASIFSWKKKDL